MENISLEAKYASLIYSYILENNILAKSRIIPIDQQIHSGNIILYINCVIDISTTITCSIINISEYNIKHNNAKDLNANIVEQIITELLNN